MGIIKICDNEEEKEEEDRKKGLRISSHNGFEDNCKDNNDHGIVGLFVLQPI